MNKLSLPIHNKKTIYRARPKDPGIQDILDWSDSTRTYVRRQHGNRYYAIKKHSGRQVSKCFQTFEEARAWRREPEASAVPINDKVLLRDVLDRFFEHRKPQLRPSTLRTYANQRQKLEAISAFEMTAITDRVIDHWLLTLRNSSSLFKPTRLSFEKELGLLRQVCGFYQEYMNEDYKIPVRSRHLRDSIVSPIKKAERLAVAKHRFLTEQQRQRFLNELATSKTLIDRFTYGTGLLQVFGGLRIGEACALRWQDVDFQHQTASIVRTVVWSRNKEDATYISDTTKTGEPREIPMTDVVVGYLRTLQSETGVQIGLVFSSDGMTPLSYRAVQYRYDMAFKKANLGFRSTHILRHSFATDFLTKTSDQAALQGILGHSTQKQTAHYAKITSELKKRAMVRFNNELNRELTQANVFVLGIAGKPEEGRDNQNSNTGIHSIKI